MATIRSALSLYDGMTGPLQSIHKALNIVLNSFEAVQNASGNVIDGSAIRDAREELARAGSQLDEIEDNIRRAEHEQENFNDRLRGGANAADNLGDKLKGVLATVASIAGTKSALGWVKENLELADTQRNAENQLKVVLTNMGVEDIEIPVTTNAEEAINFLNACADAVNILDGSKIIGSVALDAETALNTLNGYESVLFDLDGSTVKTAVELDAVNAWNNLCAYSDKLDTLDGLRIAGSVALDAGAAVETLYNYENNLEALDGRKVTNTITANTSGAIKALNQYDRAANAVDGSTVQTTLNLDTGEAIAAALEYDDWANQTDGRTIQNSIALDGTNNIPTSNTLILDTGGAIAAYNDFVNAVDGNTIIATLTMDTTQTISAFDAIAAKASEIQSRGVYGDEIMLAGAAEFATYFSDAEAIISMMDTLANYAMGMSATEGNGLGLDSSAMVQYATNLGKVMTGTYTAMSQKGFEFTDAQKAIIEGTATQVQIVEALGEEYLDCSADMQAAAAINSVIAEAWDGLYDAMSNTPEGQIVQLNNRLGDLRETLGDKIYPYVLKVYDGFSQNFPQIEEILTNLTMLLGNIILILGALAEGALNIATVISDNWSWIEPLVMGIVTALGIYYGAMLLINTVEAISNGIKAISAAHSAIKAGATLTEAAATTTATGAQIGLNAALLACPVFWIVVGIIALVAAVLAAVRALDVFGAKSHSVFGTLTGLINVAIQFFVNLGLMVANIALGIWNALGACCSNIGIAFHNVIANVQGWFYGLLSTALRVVEGICAALNKLPFVEFDYSGITAKADEYAAKSAEAYGSVEEYKSVADAFNEGFNTFDAFSTGWAQDAFDAGANWGDGVSDTISGLFKPPTLDEMGLDSIDAFNLGNNLDGIYGNTGDTAANTAAAADSLDYMDEDLAWMRDIAEREAINRYTTAEITVEQHNENHITKDTDLDGVMDAWAFDFAEKLDVSAEGVHE